MKMKKKGYAMGGMKKGYAMGGMKKKMKAGGGIKKMKAGGQTEEKVMARRANQSEADQDAVAAKFAQRGTSGRKEGLARQRKIASKAVDDYDMVNQYGIDAQKARSFGQKTQPKQGKMKGKGADSLRKIGPNSDILTSKSLDEKPMVEKKKGGSIKKMKVGGGVAKKGKAKGGKSKVRGAGIAQRGVRKAQMR